MTARLVTYTHQGKTSFGAATADDGVVDLFFAVSQDDGAIRAQVIDVLVAVDVPHA